jgi:hypothetical protein
MKPRTVRKQPPYVAFRAFTDALDHLQLMGVKGPLNRESCGAVGRETWYQLRSTLRLLHLINDQDMPTADLFSLLNDRKGMLSTLLSQYYPELFAVDLSKFTVSRFNSVLRGYWAKGDTLDRARRFFLSAARETEIRLSPELLNAGKSRRKSKPQVGPDDVISPIQAAQMHTQHKEVAVGHSNFTLTLSFDLTTMSESDHELLERLTRQLVSLQRRTQRGGRASSDRTDNVNNFSEDSDDEPVH